MADPIVVKEFGYTLPIHWGWVLLAAVAITLLVFRYYLAERGGAAKWFRCVMATMRSLTCVLVLFALMNWNVVIKNYKKSELLVCFDNSSSLQHLDKYDGDRGNSTELATPSRINALNAQLRYLGDEWWKGLEKEYSLQLYSLGKKDQPLAVESFSELEKKLTADESLSQIGRDLVNILKKGTHSDLSAILLFTDGLDSEDPKFTKLVQHAAAMNVPILPVVLGKKQPAKDLKVSGIQANRKVFLNDLVEFRVSWSADGFADQTTRLQIIDEEAQEIIAEKEFSIPADRFRDIARFQVRMLNEGKRTYAVRVLPLSGEFDTSNNQKSVAIDIGADQIKVLLAANYPSREFHFLKQFLGRESRVHPDAPPEFAINRIQLDTFLQLADIEYATIDRHAIKIFPVTRKQLFEYDVVIFCDLKPNWAGTAAGGIGASELNNLKEFVEDRGGGLIFVAGPKYTPQAYASSAIRNLFPIDLDQLESPEASTFQAGSGSLWSQAFNIRKTTFGKQFLPLQLGSDQEPKIMLDFEGPFWFATSRQLKPAATVLLELARGNQSVPGLVMHKVGNGTVVYQAFPETYRWRYRTSEVFFGRYWSQIIQYLASAKLTKGDQKLILETERTTYYRSEPVQIYGHLLDRSGSESNQISVTIQNRSGYERQAMLRRSEENSEMYSAVINELGPGSYTVYLSGNPDVSSEFDVDGTYREDQRQPVNENGLQNLAKKTGGRSIALEDLENVQSYLPQTRWVESGSEPPWYFWQDWRVLFIVALAFLVLISLEWIFRKKASML